MASQPQSLPIFGIAGEIARNFRSEKQIGHFHRKMHRNRNRMIVVAAEKSRPISQKESLRTV